jgi:hypothetical protein
VATFLSSAELYNIQQGLSPDNSYYAYNALDSAVTLRVWLALAPLLAKSPQASGSYDFVRSMQGPALDMMLHGVAINRVVRLQEIRRFEAIRDNAQSRLDRLADALWGPEHYTVRVKTKVVEARVGKRGQRLKDVTRTVYTDEPHVRSRGLNPGSPKQVLAFFNIVLGFPIEYAIRKTPYGHERTPTANDKTLLKWAKFRTRGPGIDPRDRTVEALPLGAPFVSLILTIRDATKTLGFLNSKLDADNRWRCSYNIVGTETARWSSSSNAYGRGSNTQNVTGSLRRMFCADDDYWLLSVDEEQAESRVTAGFVYAATGDLKYWGACESSDLHTTVCQMTWPELGWTDDPQANRTLAETIYPPLAHIKFTYRDVAKRLGHGSNYGGSAFGIAQAVGLPIRLVEDFQRRYFAAFPAHILWHSWVREQLLTCQYLDSPPPLLRRRHFFGRPKDDSTWREAIAHGPQSTVGEHLNLVMLKFWQATKSQPSPLPATLLLQNHDSFTAQLPNTYPKPSAIQQTNSLFLTTPLTFTYRGESRSLLIPGEFKTGYNWADKDKGTDPSKWTFKDGNPDGLSKWTGADARPRQQTATPRGTEWFDA